MEQSLFTAFVAKFFAGLVARIVTTLNGTQNAPSYLFKTMLRVEQSVDGKWESVNSANTNVMADVVAMDSALPLKKRDSISTASGNIPKQGMKLQLNEKQMTDLDILVATGAPESQIASKLFQDTQRCITGVYERNESMFLQGLSSGVVLVEDSENVGTGVRLDYGYYTTNKFGVSVLWGNPTTAKPFDDIARVLAKAAADGNTITVVMLDDVAFNRLAATDQAKQLFAFSQGFVGSNIPTPSLSQINSYASDRYGFTFKVVTRSVRYEKNGVQTSKKPWQTGSLIFLTSEQVGLLVYATLAEKNRPVAGVTYQDADGYILVSKYSKNDPLAEFTSSQARAFPVITNVDQIYNLDSTVVQA